MAMPLIDPPVDEWLRLGPFLSLAAAASLPAAPGNSGFSTPAVLDEEALAAILAVPDEEMSRVVLAETLTGELAMPAARTGNIAAPVSTARIRDLSRC
ncbi:MAG TPA: hypothetical protein VND96_05670 [Candidatus Micrarchaeaceae archaeon]|nr:hypothetical protein [Candidatus Micrarchaeaceae archaeon]